MAQRQSDEHRSATVSEPVEASLDAQLLRPDGRDEEAQPPQAGQR
jgi:hypothetical protein